MKDIAYDKSITLNDFISYWPGEITPPHCQQDKLNNWICGCVRSGIFGVIEQLADNYVDFLNFLISKKPELVINVELESSYGDGRNTMYGQLGDLFLKLRDYSLNYSTMLQSLENDKKISIITSHTLPWLTSFPNLRCTIWRPL
ncbi:hypothetical protein FACS1894137_09280 [Spirochaetia bacterium]|nr:hypothetical protein FACS1894137_09280 [Spirochaetia bacterium]